MAQYSLAEKIYNTRMAGRIRRLHIRPMNGEEQNVAAHTWGLSMILLDLFPDISKDALVFALRHDIPEVVTGDIPANVKWDNPALEEALDLREKEFLKDMGWKPEHGSVNGHPAWLRENYYIKVADRVELMFFCIEQMYMGNWLLADVYVNVREKLLDEMDEHLEPQTVERVLQYVDCYAQYLNKHFTRDAIK